MYFREIYGAELVVIAEESVRIFRTERKINNHAGPSRRTWLLEGLKIFPVDFLTTQTTNSMAESVIAASWQKENPTTTRSDARTKRKTDDAERDESSPSPNNRGTKKLGTVEWGEEETSRERGPQPPPCRPLRPRPKRTDREDATPKRKRSSGTLRSRTLFIAAFRPLPIRRE